jgi:hypothetical protein
MACASRPCTPEVDTLSPTKPTTTTNTNTPTPHLSLLLPVLDEQDLSVPHGLAPKRQPAPHPHHAPILQEKHPTCA